MTTTSTFGYLLRSTSSIADPAPFKQMDQPVQTTTIMTPMQTTASEKIITHYFIPLPLLIILCIINGLIILFSFFLMVFSLIYTMESIHEYEGSPYNTISYTVCFVVCLIFFIYNLILSKINKKRNDINPSEKKSYSALAILNGVFMSLLLIGVINNWASRSNYKARNPS
jgi:hypothetical protein